jgi:hypothetical protein
LADANGLQADASLVAGSSLTVPEVKTSSNDASTFKPYDPSEITGPTAPSLPYIAPPNAGCNVLSVFIMAVVAAVVMTYAPILAQQLPAFGAQIAAGSGVFGGLTVGAAATASAIVGAGASAVGNGVISLLGEGSFSWRQVASDGLAAGLAAGLSQVLAGLGRGAGTGATYQTAASGTRELTTLGRTLQGVGNYAGGVVANAAVGRDTDFRWSAVAASALGAYASAKLGGRLPTIEGGTQADINLMTDWRQGFINSASNATAKRLMGGGTQHWGEILADSFGNALGNAVGKATVSPRTQAPQAGEAFSPTAEQLADWDRLTSLEGRARMPTIALSGPDAARNIAATETVYRRRLVDMYEIERNGGNEDYLNVVTTYAALDAKRSAFEALPEYVTRPTAIRRSDTALRSDYLDAAHRSDAAYYDTYRGTIAGDAIAQLGTMANRAGYNLLGTANNLFGLATDGRYGDEVKGALGSVISNPGAAVGAGVEAAGAWWESPMEQKLTSAGTAGFEIISTAGLGLLRRADGAAAVLNDIPVGASNNSLRARVLSNIAENAAALESSNFLTFGRRATAREFLSRGGYSASKIATILDGGGIDFTRPVVVRTFDAGTQVQQLVKAGRIGDWFGPLGQSADASGVASGMRESWAFAASQRIQVLESRSAAVVDTWTLGPKYPVVTSGGGVQWLASDKNLFVPIQGPY